MPDADDNTRADEETVQDTPLHAYRDGREEDISGDTEAMKSDDPKDQQQDTQEGEGELSLPHEKA